MQYTESDNGKQIDVRVDEEFEIALPETRTAGYRWIAKSKGEPQCQLVDDHSQPNTAGVGGSGTHNWRFRAVSPGTSQIGLQYARSWQHATEPAKTFTLTVRVRL
jgi:inhibitor of cysteine peptidase